MSQWMSVSFLGTSSGGGPSESRNCSSLVLDINGDGSLWMVDCGEGTLRQFALQPSRPNQRTLKASRITKIFITHMHADHVMGLPTLLRNILGFPVPQMTSSTSARTPKIDIYGPAGLRMLLRTTLALTHTRSAEAYAVHELLLPTDASTPCEPVDVLHSSEIAGRDLRCDDDGFWRDVTTGRSSRGTVCLQAGPIIHRDPCIGYIFHEPSLLPIPRKLVILGDTSNAEALTPLIASTPGRVSLLVHEATDAYIPANIDSKLAAKRTTTVVKQKTEERGHSTPDAAGRCAGMWDAERLVINHIGARFPAPSRASSSSKSHRMAILHELERQATHEWRQTSSVLSSGSAKEGEALRAVAAYDYMTVQIPTSPESRVLQVDASYEAGSAAIEGANLFERERN